MRTQNERDPWTPLTSQFLTEALNRRVDDVTCTRIGIDRGFAGTVLRVRAHTGGLPALTLVAKIGPDPTLEREVVFYRDLAPRLAMPAPRCWYAGPAADGTPVVLLEDLAAARPGDALVGASIEDTASVLACMIPVWRHPATDPVVAALSAWGTDPAVRQERFRLQWTRQRERRS